VKEKKEPASAKNKRIDPTRSPKFKQSDEEYYGYRVYILVRDQAKCFLCGTQAHLHVHHIKSRGSGGTDDYGNLLTLCQGCHLGKAHGIEGAQLKATFFRYTSQFKVPDFWPKVMERSIRERKYYSVTRSEYRHKQYQRIKASPSFQRYREKQKALRKKRDREYREKHGCSYSVFKKRQYKAQRNGSNPSISSSSE
jgi:hypothetical protein